MLKNYAGPGNTQIVMSNNYSYYNKNMFLFLSVYNQDIPLV